MAKIVEKRADLRDCVSIRAEAPKRKARRMYKRLSKREQSMIDGIAQTYGQDAAEALKNLILTAKKVEANK